MPGKIRIGQLRCRFEKGKNASFPGYKNINVTSGSMNKLYTKDGRQTTGRELSPFFLGPIVDKITGKSSKTFENFWQYGKVWPSLGHAKKKDGKWQVTKKWEIFRDKGYADPVAHRRPVEVKKEKPSFAVYENTMMDYITSRKRVYIPYYCQAVKNTIAIEALVEMVKSGQNIMILDFDGPPRKDRETGKDLWPDGLEINKENIIKMVNNPKFAFGHGYVVAIIVWLLTNK